MRTAIACSTCSIMRHKALADVGAGLVGLLGICAAETELSSIEERTQVSGHTDL